MWPNEKTLWVVRYDNVTNPRWQTAAILDFDFWPSFRRRSKFCSPNLVHAVMENRQSEGSQCSKVRFLKIQDNGRQPSWMTNDTPRSRDLLFKFWKPLHNFWTEEARHFVFSLLDRPWRVLHNGQRMMNNPKWAWPGSRDLLFKFWDLGLHNF